MTEEPYTNIDLDTAENLLVAAGAGTQAQALRQYTQGIRNLVQGEFGMSFVNALDGIMAKHIGPLSQEIGGLRGDTSALQAEFRDGLSGVAATVSTLAEAVDTIQGEVSALKGRMDSSEEDRADIRARLAVFDADALVDIRGRLAALEDWKEQVAALRADFSALSARIGDALPTEADQALSADLREDAAERADDGT